MRHPGSVLAVFLAVTHGACAARQAEPVRLPLAPAIHPERMPRDAACAGLIERALARDAEGGFKLAGMLITHTDPTPGHPTEALRPTGSHPADIPSRQLDGTFRALFVNCETRQAYVSKRGAVIDITYWYGPFGL